MVRVTVLLWRQHLQVFAAQDGQRPRRLAGAPWDEAGSMPLLLGAIGRERYIGTQALQARMACRRAVLDDLAQPLRAGPAAAVASERLALFLCLLCQAVERRYPHDALEWCLRIAPAHGLAAHLPAACWLAGLEHSAIAALPALPPLAFPSPASSLGVLAYFEGGRGVAALASLAPSAALLEHAHGDALACPGPQDALLQRAISAQARRDGRGRGLVAVPREGRWWLERSDHAQRTRARALQPLMARMAQAAAGPHLAARVEWEDAVDASAEPHLLGLEAMDALFTAEPPTLAHALAFALEPGHATAAERVIVAPAGTALPYAGEHTLVLRRGGQRLLPFELCAIEAGSGRVFRLAHGSIALPAESRARGALQLRVACHRCGAIELRFEIPAWRYGETLLVDPAGRLHPDAERRASQIQRSCP
jgi:hypothetical protein